ncbi:AurF N-oxygenase family protein [Streptomyces sp. NPDC000405]|uniref:AurF N-oxygenase family protein n=1 Tax=Streptomyces sp. NPDC000405 TaxID=3161033 RepID=UPI00398CA621
MARRLLSASATRSYDPDKDVDWEVGAPDDAWFAPPDLVSLYGTATWDRLDARQRVELSRQELASYMSMGYWVELLVLRMFSRHLTSLAPTDPRGHYALTELGDETRHMKMFGRCLSALGCPVYPLPASVRRLFPLGEPLFQDLTTFAVTLVGEEVLDHYQRALLAAEHAHPLVRQICRIHVAEEARHVSFARTELRDAVRRASRRRLAFHRELTGCAASLIIPGLLDPSLYARVGLDPVQARREAGRNPHHKEFRLRSGAKLVAFLQDVGMITPAQHHWWRRAGLMR